MLSKPPHGSPCNNCGGCCVDRRCPLGQIVFGPGSDCPALEVKLPGFVCGLVQNPARYAPRVVAKHGAETASRAAALIIGAGMGCDALLEGERPNQEWRAWAMQTLDRKQGERAATIWRGRR